MTTMNPGELSLIRTKLAPPRMAQVPVSRDALLQQLDAQRDRKLSLVLGPAGCGKTTLLTQWRKQLFLQGAKVAWYYAGADDDDAHIAAYIVESLRQAGLPIGEEGLHLFRRSSGKAWKPLLASLINDLSQHEGKVYLVIDDFHYVSSFAILQLLDRWLALAPPGFHLVLGSRMRPPLGLARLRAEDQLTELSFSELRFGLDETRRFVEAQGLKQLSPMQVATLHELTDGWVAGLQLLTFSLRKHKTPEAFFERQGKLSLSQEEALDGYLAKAAVEHLTEQELSFLTRISACRRFNRELCEVITGDPRAAEYLAKFEAENLFLIPIDTSDAEPWYRFHRLFASFLNNRLRRLEEAEVRTLHQLASRWFAGKNLHVEAMRHASFDCDTDFLVELIDRAARRMINGANFVQLLKWCDSVPRERLRTRLNVCLCAAWAQLSCSRVEDFDRTMEDIRLHPSHARPDVAVEVQLLKAYHFMRQDDTASSLRIVEPMMRDAPPGNTFHSLMICNIASLSLLYANRFEQARDVARSRHRYGIPERPDYPKPLVDVVLGFSHLVQGNIALATASLTPYMDDALRTTAFGADAAGLFAGYLLEAYYQSDEIQLARGFLERYFELIDAVGVGDGVLFAYRVRARIEQLDGNTAAARQTLQRLEEIGYRQGLDRVVAWSLYEQVGLALKSPQNVALEELLRRLDQFAERYRQHRDCVWCEIPLAAWLARADAAFEQSTDAACLPSIDAADAAARGCRRQLLTTRLGLMRAIVLLRAGRPDEALSIGREMIRIAGELGMTRLLADLGAKALPLIAVLLASPVNEAEREYLQAASEPFEDGRDGSSAARDEPPDRGPATALLSVREREVLDLLSKALSMKSIARALDLSPGTVKWHLKNVYGKLSAVSREDALAKSRRLGIIR